MLKHVTLQLALFFLVECSIKEGQLLAEYLWEKTAEYQQQALNSSLIQGMVNKCLDPSEFGGYMVQDNIYLHEGSGSLKIAAGRSDDNVTLQAFLNTKAEHWLNYWKDSNKIWHIENVEGLWAGEAARAYVDEIRDVSENEMPIYTVVALTPCAKLWPWLGQQIGAKHGNFGVYTKWVSENLDPDDKGYEKWEQQAQWAYEAGKITAEKALDIFSTSMRNEANFFNSVARCGCMVISPSGYLLTALISVFLYHR